MSTAASVLVAEQVEKAWADRVILQGCDLRIGPRDRVGLVGINGSGKSTLLSILAGTVDADHGSVRCTGTRALLGQDPVLVGETVGDVAEGAVAWHHRLVAEFEAATAAGDDARVGVLHDRLDDVGWQVGHQVDAVLDRVGAPPRTARTEALSGGERRRVALACALLTRPDVLMLDEPTNHLDADTIDWLQAYLLGYRGAILLVTHDRYLLEAVAERIVEVEDGQLHTTEGSYTDYLLERADRHARTSRDRQRLLSTIAREAAWASRSPSARTGKQKARLQRLDALRERVPQLKDRSFTFDLRTGFPRGSTLLEAYGLRLGFPGRELVSGLDLTLRPGERVGILGANGTGKTTLLRVLAGELDPLAGQLVRHRKLRLGMLDQARSGLALDDTVFEAAGGGAADLKIGDDWVQVASFLGRFDFTRPMFDQKVGALSGGERARLLLAKLMLAGANLLMLDEPTNDLDLLTLRSLEEALMGFDGGALIATHDRAFLDRVCTSVLAFEGDGRVVHYASRLQHVAALSARRSATREKKERVVAPRAERRLSYRERRELEGLPDAIEALEAELEGVEGKLAEPETYRAGGALVSDLTTQADGLRAQIEGRYARWEELSELS